MNGGRSAFFFFCDDVRQEELGKTTFVGVYGGACDLPSFPANVSGLSVVLLVDMSSNELVKSLQMSVSFNLGGERHELGTQDVDLNGMESAVARDVPKFRLQVVAKIPTFHLPSGGEIEAKGIVDGEELAVGHLTFRKAPG